MSESPVGLRAAREDTIDALCRQFAQDALSMGELERRLAKAREARTRDELDVLLSDLPAARPVPAVTTRTAVRAPAPERTPQTGVEPRARTASHLAFAVMAGTRRAGRWAPPSSMTAVAIMGGVELDFRDAVLKPGVTDITCFALWGGIEITVPPEVHVDTRGFALLGGFDQTANVAEEPGPDAPVLRITGLAIMGGVEVKVKSGGSRRK